METSKARIDRELARPTTVFCYPNGDTNAVVLDAVKQAGFALAVTTRPGLNHEGADPLLLKRISVDPSLHDYYFREEVAGLHSR